jgi:hypothetical protein
MLQQCPNPECGRDQTYRNDKSGEEYFYTIGIEMPRKYDGVIMWECPFCHFKWPRHEVWR